MRRALNQALELLQNEYSTLEALVKLIQQIKSKNDDLSKKNEEVEALSSLEKLEEEIEEIITFREEIDNCVFELDKIVKRLSTAKGESTQQRINPDGIGLLQQTNTRLPKLEMPLFKDVLSFPSYWDLFDANINSLTTLTSVQKFSYQKTTLEGEPSTLSANLEITAANYNYSIGDS